MLLRDYVAGNFTRDDLAPFDAVVFAAGNDIRHLPPGTDEAAHWERANVDAVPRFFALAREAGVKRAVLVGSFYPQVAPALVDTVPYVRSRHLADERVRALATPSFAVCSVNAPFVVGSVPGLRNEMFAAYTGYAQGQFAGCPCSAGRRRNFISTQSLSEAIWGALQRGEAGKAYLVGDENLSFADYFAAFFRAAGNPRDVPSLDTRSIRCCPTSRSTRGAATSCRTIRPTARCCATGAATCSARWTRSSRIAARSKRTAREWSRCNVRRRRCMPAAGRQDDYANANRQAPMRCSIFFIVSVISAGRRSFSISNSAACSFNSSRHSSAFIDVTASN